MLRPNLLSIYKDAGEVGFHGSVAASDLTAVARVRDPKDKRENVFGLFSPSKNYYMQADSAKEAQSWVDAIRKEARVEESEETFFTSAQENAAGQQTHAHDVARESEWPIDRGMSSSPEPHISPIQSAVPESQRQNSHTFDYSGPEMYSDLSDVPGQSGPEGSSTSLPQQASLPSSSQQKPYPGIMSSTGAIQPSTKRNASQMSGIDFSNDPERVVWHGWLLCLKKKGGVRQWKKLWVVVRQKNLSFYKNKQVGAQRRHIILSF